MTRALSNATGHKNDRKIEGKKNKTNKKQDLSSQTAAVEKKKKFSMHFERTMNFSDPLCGFIKTRTGMKLKWSKP